MAFLPFNQETYVQDQNWNDDLLSLLASALVRQVGTSRESQQTLYQLTINNGIF